MQPAWGLSVGSARSLNLGPKVLAEKAISCKAEMMDDMVGAALARILADRQAQQGGFHGEL